MKKDFRGKNRFLWIIITAAAIILAIALSLNAFAAITTSQNVPSIGTVTTSANLAVYSDSACTQPLSTINWGTLSPGGTTNQTIYVKNTSSGLSLTLSMTTNNWSSTNASGSISVTWNQQGIDLLPGQSAAATLTLIVSSSIVDVTGFSVNICIGGTNP